LSRREKIRLEEQLKKKKKIRWGRIIALILVIVGIILTYKYDLIPKAILLIKPILIQNIEISSEKVQIELGESINISSKIYPENYSKSELTWHSSNDEILEVDNGAVTGKSVGKANIYLADGETKSNELEIECLVSINEVIVNNLVSEIKLGEIYTLETTVLPENATYKELTYESSNTDIITVNDNGSLIANAIGKTTIVIKNYKDEILTSFDIEVKKIPVENITLDDKEVTLGKGQTYIINSKVTPLEATYTDVEWQTSDKNIVKANRLVTIIKGIITGVFLLAKSKIAVSLNKTLSDNFEKVYDTSIQTSIQNIIKEQKENKELLSAVGQMTLCFTEVIVFFALAILSRFIGEKVFILIYIILSKIEHVIFLDNHIPYSVL